MPWYLQLALRQLFPSGRRRPSFFFLVSVLGVTLGVMILVIVQSVMGGFDHEHRAKMVLTSGHVDVRANGGIIRDRDALLKTIHANKEVAAAVPYAQGLVMLTCDDRPAFPYIMGMDFTVKPQVVPLDQLLIAGSMKDMDDDSVLLSSRLADNIGAQVGSSVDVYTPLMIEKLKADEVMLPRHLRVCGIYETGWTPFDTNTMVGTLPLMQDLYDMGKGIHGVAIRLKTDSDDQAFALADKLNNVLPGSETAATWMETNRDFLWVLALEKNMMFFLLLFIILVAAFAISVAQLLTVLRKTREIGILEAMGARPTHLALLYCFQGFFIGLIGTALGCVGAVVALHYRDPIVSTLARLTHSRAALEQFYQFSQLPVFYDPKDFIVIGAATLFISTAAGLIPALRAAYMKPAEALRSE
jgi:lipoprotein-releasing system permease protein